MSSFEKARNWVVSDCWIASFDILGFKSLMAVDQDDFKSLTVRIDNERTIKHLKKNCEEYDGQNLNYCWFSDTFLMFTPDDSAQSYCVIQNAAKFFISDCVTSRIPIRGAISVGSFMYSSDKRSFIGKAFLDAYEYGEDQNWLGLILSPNAIKKIDSYNLNLIYDFVGCDTIPMRKYNSEEVLAYKFQNGASNMPCPLLPMLNDMKSLAGTKHQGKYDRTIKFIEDYYVWK